MELGPIIRTFTYNLTKILISITRKSPCIISATFIYGVLTVKNFISDGIGKTICSSWNLSGKQFMIPFSNYKMKWTWINSKFSIVKISRCAFCYLALFGIIRCFFGICLSDFLHTFAKAISLMRSSYLFGNNYFGNFELGVLIVFLLFY